MGIGKSMQMLTEDLGARGVERGTRGERVLVKKDGGVVEGVAVPASCVSRREPKTYGGHTGGKVGKILCGTPTPSLGGEGGKTKRAEGCR